MSRLVWDEFASRDLRYGIDQGVVYPRIGSPVAWNGLVNVTESPEEASSKVFYYDGQSYVKQTTVEGFAASIEAITYPDVLDQDDEFDLCYRVKTEDGYLIHLVYNARLSPAEVAYTTLDDAANPATFKWSLTTVPEQIDRLRPTAHVVIDTNDTYAPAMALVLDLIYGKDGADPRMPHLPELRDIYEANAIFTVVDHGDGTWTATGPDEWIVMLDSTSFEITSPSAVPIDSESYTIATW